MQATYAPSRDLVTLYSRLADMERLATTQEWWMYGRALHEAGRIAELVCLLSAARADLAQLLETLGHPQVSALPAPPTSALCAAQSYAGDSGWALAHREEALSVLRLASIAVPVLLAQSARIRGQLGEGSAAARVRLALARICARLNEARGLLSE